MFVNYFLDDERRSPINLAVARFILSFWLIWKTIWYNWAEHVETPYRAVAGQFAGWAIPVSAPWILTVEKWILIALLCLFAVGYRIRSTASMSSLLVAHLATVRGTLVKTGETSALFLGVYVLLFYALYAETDELSVDGVRRFADQGRQSIVDRLTSGADRQYRMPPLKYSLLVLAILYASSGLSKIVAGSGLGFAAPDTLPRIILVFSYVYPWTDLEMLIVEYPILAVIGGFGTLVLEVGFLFAVLTGIAFSPFVLGLILFTISNAVVLGIFFSDNLFLIAMFAAYDRAYAGVVSNRSDRSVDLVFDETEYHVARWLYPFKLLDVHQRIEFYSQYTVPIEHQTRAALPLDSPLYLFDGDDMYEGYPAFRELLRQYRVFLPLVWLLGLSPVSRLGKWWYRHVRDSDV